MIEYELRPYNTAARAEGAMAERAAEGWVVASFSVSGDLWVLYSRETAECRVATDPDVSSSLPSPQAAQRVYELHLEFNGLHRDPCRVVVRGHRLEDGYLIADTFDGIGTLIWPLSDISSIETGNDQATEPEPYEIKVGLRNATPWVSTATEHWIANGYLVVKTEHVGNVFILLNNIIYVSPSSTGREVSEAHD